MSVFIYRKSQPNLPLTDISQFTAKEISKSDLLWIDLYCPTKAEEETIETELKIDIITEEEQRGMEESASFFEESGNIYLDIDVPARIGAKPYIMPTEPANYQRANLSFVLTPDCLVSFRNHAFRALEVGSSRASARLEGIKTPSAALIAIVEAIIERQADLLASLGREVDLISVPVLAQRHLLKAEPRLKKLGALGAQLALCRDCLYDLRRMLHFLSAHQGIYEFNKPRLGEIREDIGALQRNCEAQSNDLTFLLDATLGLVGARQSRALNFMAIVTLLFAPPTLISSIFGMNFSHWTFFQNPQGHLISFGLMALSALIVVGIARLARLF